jgi:predicted nucleic acid-binding protein
VILLDANILMYAAGTRHKCKAPALRLLSRVASGEVSAAVDAEVLQEILHRYRRLTRWADGTRVYELARQIVSVVLPVTVEVMDAARGLMERHPHLAARDAVHAAVVFDQGLRGFCSFDADSDRVTGLRRVLPTTCRRIV